MGRLEAHKNWLPFLEIAGQAARSGKAAIWLLGGQRATEQQQQVLWDFVSRQQLVTRFRWFPEIAPQQMPGFYQAVARSGGCLVSTSKNESFGLSVLEALASGCPVVAPAVGGLTEIVQDGQNGFLYPPGAWQTAARQVALLIHTPALQRSLGEAAAQSARAFSLPAVIDRFLLALENLAAAEAPATPRGKSQ